MNELRLYLQYWHKNSNGKTIKYRRYRSDSFVGNFFKFLYAQYGYNNPNVGVSDNAVWVNAYSENTPKTVDNEDANFYARVATSIVAGSGITTLGIVVGSGTTPVTINDYSLVSQIPHGTAVGQIVYAAMSGTSVTPLNTTLGNDWYYRITRQFTNSSSSVITINEVGLIANFMTTSGALPCLVARDVLPTPIILNPNDHTTIQYTIRLTI